MIITGFIIVPVMAASTAKPVTVAMSMTPLSAPFIIADEKGYFEKNNLNVTIKNFIGGYRSAKAMFKGEADIATSSEAVVMFNSFKRSDFAVFATFVSSDNDVKIITKKSTGIKTVADLSNRSVGTILEASAQFFLDQTLLINGVDRGLMKIINISPENSFDSLMRGDIDAMVVWEPYVHFIQNKLKDRAFIVPHGRAYIETFNALVMRDFAQKNKDILKGLIRALIEATRFLVTHTDEAQRIVAKRIGMELTTVQKIWPDFSFEVSLHQSILTTLEAEARWAISLGLVDDKKMPDYLDYLYLDPLKQVNPRAITVFQ